MNNNYYKLRSYFKLGLWDEQKLRDAVAKKLISPDEFKSITGKNYE